MQDVALETVFHRNDLGTPVEVYPYQRLDGSEAFYVCRWEPKTFRPAQLQGGRVFWNLNDAPTLLYRWPEVAAALNDGETIWIVDGEKDADALARHEAVATCCARSQGWTVEHAEALSGARSIRIVADRDGGTGLEQANGVLDTLTSVAGIPMTDILLVQSASGKDAFDHLEAGFGLDAFEPIEEEVDGIRFVDLESVITRDPDWLMRGYIPAGELTVLQGHGGCNKGTFAAQLAAVVTKGKGDSQYGIPGQVLWASAEDALGTILKPRLIAAGAVIPMVKPFNVRLNGVTRPLSLPEDIPALREAVERVDAKLLIIDPLLSHLSGKVDSHRDHDVKRALRPLAQMANETGCSVLGVHHMGKDTSRGALLSGMGSAAFGNTARIVLAMAEHDEDEDLRILEVVKTNISKKGLRKLLRVELVHIPGLAEVVPLTVEAGESDKSIDELGKKKNVHRVNAKSLIVKALEAGPQTMEHLKSVCFAEGLDGDTAWMSANALKAEGKVGSMNSGPGTPWRWSLLSTPAAVSSVSGETPAETPATPSEDIVPF